MGVLALIIVAAISVSTQLFLSFQSIGPPTWGPPVSWGLVKDVLDTSVRMGRLALRHYDTYRCFIAGQDSRLAERRDSDCGTTWRSLHLGKF